MLTACIDRVLASLHAARPEMGETAAIDGSDLPAYANGQRFVSRGGALRKRFSDPDASWGHRSSVSTRSGGGFTVTRSTPPSAPSPACRSRGGWRRRRTPN